MKTAEDIIISKRFFELNASEREAVKELVSNEEEYEAMRWFLTGTADSFAKEKVEPSANLRKGVLAHLQQKQVGSKTIWLNGVGSFLFPSEKKLYQYPALQIAAVAVLFISVVAVYNSSADLNESLAINDTEELNIPEEKMIDEGEKAPEDAALLPEQKNEGMEEQVASEDTGIKSSDILLVDQAPAEAAYYREMSVAEEIKYAETDDIVTVLDNVQSTSATSGSVSRDDEGGFFRSTVTENDMDSKNESTKLKDSDKSLKQTTTKKDSNASLEDVTTVSPNVPAGSYNYSTTEKTTTEEKESGQYLTGSAGGVFGDTAADSTSSEKGKPEAEEQEKKFSINDTKILKKLIFTVK